MSELVDEDDLLFSELNFDEHEFAEFHALTNDLSPDHRPIPPPSSDSTNTIDDDEATTYYVTTDSPISDSSSNSNPTDLPKSQPHNIPHGSINSSSHSHPSNINVPHHNVPLNKLHTSQSQFYQINQNFHSPSMFYSPHDSPSTSSNTTVSLATPSKSNSTGLECAFATPQSYYSTLHTAPHETNQVFSRPHPANLTVPLHDATMNYSHFPLLNHSSPYHSHHVLANPYMPYLNNFQRDMENVDGSVQDFFIRNQSVRMNDPYSTGTPSSSSTGILTTNSRLNTHCSSSASLPQPVRRAVYKKEKGKTSQMCRIFPDILPIDNTRTKYQNTGKDQLWFFILKLLGDVSKKSIIAWTGDSRYFRVKDTGMLCRLWSDHMGRTTAIQWESLRRTIRTAGANGILMAVPSTRHKGMNEEGLYGFVIEPSFYLNMTKEELNEFITANCETAPPTPEEAKSSVRYSPY